MSDRLLLESGAGALLTEAGGTILLDGPAGTGGLRTVETLVRQVLLNDADVFAQVNSRIYPLERPQNSALPAITYQRVSSTRVDPLAGVATLANARLQLVAFAVDYGKVKDLGIYMRRALNGYVQGPGALPRLRGIRALPDNADERDEAPADIYRERRDYSVWYDEL